MHIEASILGGSFFKGFFYGWQIFSANLCNTLASASADSLLTLSRAMKLGLVRWISKVSVCTFMKETAVFSKFSMGLLKEHVALDRSIWSLKSVL